MYLRSPSISHWTKPPVPQTPMTLPKRTPSLKQLPQPSTPVKDIRNSTRTIFSPRLCPATQQENLHTASSPFVQCRTLKIPQVGLTNQLGCQAKNDVNHPCWTTPLVKFGEDFPIHQWPNAQPKPTCTRGHKGSHPRSTKKPCEAWQMRWQSNKEGTIPSGFLL